MNDKTNSCMNDGSPATGIVIATLSGGAFFLLASVIFLLAR